MLITLNPTRNVKNISRNILSSVAMLLFPALALAQTASGTQTLTTITTKVVGYLNTALQFLMGLAVLMFVFYVIRYFIQPTDNRSEAWQYVLWSLVGFFVIFSMWGLVNVLISSFGLQSNPSSWSTYFNIFPTS